MLSCQFSRNGIPSYQLSLLLDDLPIPLAQCRRRRTALARLSNDVNSSDSLGHLSMFAFPPLCISPIFMVVAKSYWHVITHGTSLYLSPMTPLCMPRHATKAGGIEIRPLSEHQNHSLDITTATIIKIAQKFIYKLISFFSTTL
jgi:hypothetical protein